MVRWGPRFDVSNTSQHERSLLRTSPREPFQGWGSRRFLVTAPGLNTTRLAQRLLRVRLAIWWQYPCHQPPARFTAGRLRAHVQAGG